MGTQAASYEGRTTPGTLREVARDVVARDELPVVEGLARFGDATVVRRLRHRDGRRRERLGFGAGEVTALVTGAVWLALDQTVRQLGERAADCAPHGARDLLRRVFRRHAEPATVPSLAPEQLAEVRQRVLEVAARRGLEREYAETVADAMVARLALGAAGAVKTGATGSRPGDLWPRTSRTVVLMTRRTPWRHP
ncbi:hypothetical protein ACFU6I_24075 [Streptomyces sp. NPDC057486]|uniref:hypothetical protein n=1 Tax=Streptomyces sp. NPDC057486 TaxID=3346145 RepID=UPI00369DC7C4